MNSPIIKKRLSRAEKATKVIEKFKEELDSRKEQISEEEYNNELLQFIIQTKQKYRKIKKSKSQKIEENKYEIMNDIKLKHPNLTNKELLKISQPIIKQKLEELLDLPKKSRIRKKHNRTKTQKLDRRRTEFVRQLKENFPDITEKDVEKKLEEYNKVESAILHDDILFNKKISKLREELNIKYGKDYESLSKIKKSLIKRLMDDKRKFLGITEEKIQKSDSQNDDTKLFESSEWSKIKKKQVEEEKIHILSMSNSDKKKQIEDIIDRIDEVFPNKSPSELSEKLNKNQILEVDNDIILLQKYETELEEKFQNTKYIFEERRNLINAELKILADKIRKDIKIDRKLLNEREELEKEWSQLNKYQNKSKVLRKDVDKYMKRRKEILEEYRDMGIDPDEQDKTSLDTANSIWKDVNNTVKKNLKKWNEMTEKQKLDPFIEKYQEFSTSYQLILKYMVFKLEYSPEAFSKFLKICRRNLPKPNAKQDEIQDIRFENQARYVQYLYEEYQKKKKHHIDRKKAQYLFEETLKKLRKEKKEFKKKYEETKKKLDDEKIIHGKELLSELITKIKSGKLLDEEEEDAISILNDVLEMQYQQQQNIDDVAKDCVKGFTKLSNIS